MIFNNNSDTNNEQQNNITQNNEYIPNNQGVSSEYIYSVLNERGFNTYEINPLPHTGHMMRKS